MIPSEIAALRALAEKATPGQWTVGASSHEIDVPDGEDGLFSVATAELPEDAAFIAAASPSVVIALLDALEAAESRAAALEAERDARPEILPRHAKHVLDFIFSGMSPRQLTENGMEAMEAVMRALRSHAAKATSRFAQTSCSQCGGEFGPGDHGFSHCSDHAGKAGR